MRVSPSLLLVLLPLRAARPATTPAERLAEAARELDDRAAARLARGPFAADPELAHTFLRAGAKPSPRR